MSEKELHVMIAKLYIASSVTGPLYMHSRVSLCGHSSRYLREIRHHSGKMHDIVYIGWCYFSIGCVSIGSLQTEAKLNGCCIEYYNHIYTLVVSM